MDNELNLYMHVVVILSGHLSGDTHSFRSSSITVPSGHSHLDSLHVQVTGQTVKWNLLVHVVAQEVQFFRNCPLTGQVTSQKHMHTVHSL